METNYRKRHTIDGLELIGKVALHSPKYQFKYRVSYLEDHYLSSKSFTHEYDALQFGKLKNGFVEFNQAKQYPELDYVGIKDFTQFN